MKLLYTMYIEELFSYQPISEHTAWNAQGQR
jgi:hypothetical protein